MPTLQFKGKSIIWNHHMSVPYHTLETVPELDYNTDKANGNIIVEGDNLVALKALLPQYAGKVDCIYIDPPYNTGNEGWAYNDNVNSPMINEWLGKEVNSDDLTRHDKWLCMMTPRLKLLHDLLKESGIIFISIDDNEQANLKLLCDEIFGEVNFIAQTVRASNSTKNNSNYLSITHDYALVYSKSKENVTKNWQVDKRNVKDFQKIAKRMLKQKLPLSEIESELRALVKYPKYYDFDHYYYCDEKGVYRTDNSGG
ncbi:MAG: site-specific DNA-methyltransferase [Campylobacterota bacterium]|nr:site-specific DNA-methyltransferase [Campylobacterota bacterium]